MNTDQMEGKWKQMKGALKQKWGNLTDDDLKIIEGNRDQLVGKVQERYGIAREDAQKQVEEWKRTQSDFDVDEADRDLKRRA
ncbi:MAG TPA: CsbD family protein [Terriglobales bacterium]|nr:CsbD family protein [Terriglobales bacterium]